MRKLSFLFPLLSLLLIHCAFSYSVVLKSGKTIEGKWISENETTIQIKDQQGICLTFKKSIVDLTATARLNRATTSGPVPQPRSVVDKRSVVDIADELKRSRTGKSHIVSQEDLDRAPAISIFGSTSTSVARADGDVASMPNRNERYWHEEADSLKRALSAAADKKREAEAACSEAREQGRIRISKRRSDQVLILVPNSEPRECTRARQLGIRWEEANRRWLDFAERARREEVPWQWLD